MKKSTLKCTLYEQGMALDRGCEELRTTEYSLTTRTKTGHHKVFAVCAGMSIGIVLLGQESRLGCTWCSTCERVAIPTFSYSL